MALVLATRQHFCSSAEEAFMSNGNGGGQPQQVPTDSQVGQPQPQLSVVGQYIKDFSFENPNAPRSLGPSQNPPTIGIQINVGVGQLAESDFEVQLKIEGKAEAQNTVLFAFDLTFAGVFRLQNVPQQALSPVLMIECPRLLFPFAREIIASAVRGGGFPQLLLDPVDFVALYQQRLAASQEQPAATPTTA
jgi:preprotein translocase subunit SecB